MWVHRIQILKLKCELESSEFLVRLWKSRPRSLGFWLFISPVGPRHFSLFRNLCLWTWATKALSYTNIFCRRALAFPCCLWFMLSIRLRAFLAWSLKNISPEAKFSTAACHGGGRETPALAIQLYPIIFGIRGLLTCKTKHTTARSRSLWHAWYFISSIFKEGILVLTSQPQMVVVKIN